MPNNTETQTNEDTQDSKQSKEQYIERMLSVATEQVILDADMKAICDEAKAAGYDAAMLKKIAVAKARDKLDELAEKTQNLLDEIEAMS